MDIKIEIDDRELQKEVTELIARKLAHGYERNMFKRAIVDAVREVVYSSKDEIIDMVVSRASREVTNKAVPKLVSKMMEDER